MKLKLFKNITYEILSDRHLIIRNPKTQEIFGVEGIASEIVLALLNDRYHSLDEITEAFEKKYPAMDKMSSRIDNLVSHLEEFALIESYE